MIPGGVGSSVSSKSREKPQHFFVCSQDQVCELENPCKKARPTLTTREIPPPLHPQDNRSFWLRNSCHLDYVSLKGDFAIGGVGLGEPAELVKEACLDSSRQDVVHTRLFVPSVKKYICLSPCCGWLILADAKKANGLGKFCSFLERPVDPDDVDVPVQMTLQSSVRQSWHVGIVKGKNRDKDRKLGVVNVKDPGCEVLFSTGEFEHKHSFPSGSVRYAWRGLFQHALRQRYREYDDDDYY